MTRGVHAWHGAGRRAVRLLDRSELWGVPTVEVLDVATGVSSRLRADELQPIEGRPWTAAEVAWRAAACRAIERASRNHPVATVAHGVRLLPHQERIVSRAIAMEPVRLGICDEVGLGKTITAAAIVSELKARGRVSRVLVVAPKGVQLQWVAELSQRFSEELVRVGPEGLPVDAGVDPWRAFPQVICSLDAVKPLRARAGWDVARIAAYNEQRTGALVAAGWDLVIFDEAHHVAGSSDDVARHRLARELAQSVPNILLLSGTPHSGKSEGFRRFLGLLDAELLSGRPLARDDVSRLVERTEKRAAVDLSGRPLFGERTTTLEVVPYGDRIVERDLYEQVTEYVREGYGRALRERRPAVGFLVLLMQRLVASSTAAIRTALEKRAGVLDALPEQQSLLSGLSDDWAELSGEEQLESLVELRGQGWVNERADVNRLLRLAMGAEAAGSDAKVRHFIELARRLETEENDPQLKLLVFTEFLPTQQMLLQSLADSGIVAVGINGSMSLGERAMAQDAFRETARVLVSTDAGGEGINLQFAHVVVNWDLPWTPTKIEQRIGRVDRIGQQSPVRAFNLVGEHSVDLRVIEVLEAKLLTILEELGADKRGDVLESLDASSERLYVEAILEAPDFGRTADAIAAEVRADVLDRLPLLDLIADEDVGGRALAEREVNEALEHLVAAWESWSGGRAPEDVLELLRALPEAVPGEPIPTAAGDESGWWSCWEVGDTEARRTCVAVFVSDDGAVRPDVAERIWRDLQRCEEVSVLGTLDDDAWKRLQAVGHDHGFRAWERIKAHGAVPVCRPRLLVRVVGQ